MPENDYIQGLYTNLEAAYGKENLPDPATFRKRISSDEAYLKGVYSNLESAYGKDNLPDEKTFIDRVKKKEPTPSSGQQGGSPSPSASKPSNTAVPQGQAQPVKPTSPWQAAKPATPLPTQAKAQAQPKEGLAGIVSPTVKLTEETPIVQIPKVQAQQQLEEQAKVASGQPIVTPQPQPQSEGAFAPARLAPKEAVAEKPIEVGAFEGFINAVKRGWKQGGVADMMALGRTPTPEEIKEIARLQKEQSQIPASGAYDRFSQATGFVDAAANFVTHPLEITSQLVTESLTALLRHGVTRIPAGVATGAAVGSVVPGAGTIAGISSGFVAGMGLTGYNLEVSASILESLQEAGIDVTDEVSLQEGFKDEAKMKEAREYAMKRGVPIALFDMFSGGVAGKILGKPAKTVVGKVGQALVETGIQSTAAGAGEATAQLVSKGELNGADIFAEAIGEIGGGAPDIVVGTIIEAKKRLAKENAAQQQGVAPNEAAISENVELIKSEMIKNNIPVEQFNEMVDISEGAGELSDIEANELKASYAKVQELKAEVPEKYSNNVEVITLLENRKQLEQQLEKTDAAFKGEVQAQIDDINSQMQVEAGVPLTVKEQTELQKLKENKAENTPEQNQKLSLLEKRQENYNKSVEQKPTEQAETAEVVTPEEVVAETEKAPETKPVEVVEEQVDVDGIKQLETEYNGKSVDELVALKKQLYPNPDIESAMSPEEKLLDRVIAKKFSEKNAEIKARRDAKKAPAVQEVDITDLESEPKKASNKKVEEINSLPLTHVGGLNMRPDQSEGTYLSTEKAGNRYERQGGSKRKGKVKISKPYVTNDTGNISLRNRVLNNSIDDFTDEDFAMYEKPKGGKVTIDDLNDSGIRKLAAKTTELLKSKGYDSIYFPETDTQEGELIVFDRNNVELEEVVIDTVSYKKGGISYNLTKYGEGKEARYTKQSGGKGNPENPIDATEFYKQKNASDKRVARSKNAYANRGVKAEIRNNIAKNFYPQSINDAVLYYIGMGWGLTKETIQKAFKNKEGAEVKAWLKIVGNNQAEGKSDAHRMAETIANDYPGLANNEAMADDKDVANAIADVLNSYTSIEAILDDLSAMSGDNVNDVDAIVERAERQQAEEAERIYKEEIKKEKEQAEIEDKLLKERFEAMTPEERNELLEFLNNFEDGTEPKRQGSNGAVPKPQSGETKSGAQDDGKNEPIGEREREANRRLQEAEKELAEAKKKLADKTKSLREQQGKEAQGSIFEKPLAAGQIFEAEADLRESTLQKALQPLKSIVDRASQNVESAKANIEKARKADREQGKIVFEEVEVAPSSVDKGQVGEGQKPSPASNENPALASVEATAKALEDVDIEKIVVPKNTKVVDENGNPLKLYHVSENDIVGDLRVVNDNVLSWYEKRPQSEKDLYQIDENGNYTEIGVHFGGEGTVKDFIERYGINPKTKLSVFLDIKNPIEIRDLAAWTPTNIIKELDIIGYQVGVKKEKHTANEAIEILNRLGIDGFKYQNIYEYQGEKYSYMAINPNQIVIIDKNKISEAYHKAKADGSNPELVKAVEDLIGKPKEEAKPKSKEKVTIKPTSEKELTDAMEKVFGLKKPMAKRVAKVIAQSAKGLIKAGVFADEKAFWDAFPTLSDEKVSEITEAQQQGAKGMYRAAINFINALTNPDLSTPLHEVSHWWLTVLDASSQGGNKEAKRMLDAFEVFAKSGEGQKFWNKNFTGKFNPSNYKFRQELFARSWEKYLYDGVVPPSLKKLFDGFMNFMKEIYKDLTDINIQLSPNMLVLFNGIMGEDMKFDQVPAETVDIAVDELSDILDELEGLFQEPSDKKEEDGYDIKRLRKAEEQGRVSSGEINEIATTVLSRLHEAVGEKYGTNSSQYTRIVNEEEAFLEDLSKEGGFWVDDADKQYGDYYSNGQENVVYINPKNTSEVVKLNNGGLDANWLEFLDRVALHNAYFPSTAYTVEGFGKTSKGEFVAILKQPFIQANAPTSQEINDYMTQRGFERLSKYDDSIIGTVEEDRSFIDKKNGIIVEDLHLGNVMKGEDGNMFVIDPVISLDTPDRGYGGTRTPNEGQEDTALFQESQSNNAKSKLEDSLTAAAEKAVQSGLSKKDFIAKLKSAATAEKLFKVISEKEVGKIFDKVAKGQPTDNIEEVVNSIVEDTGLGTSPRRYIARGLDHYADQAYRAALQALGAVQKTVKQKLIEPIADKRFREMLASGDPAAAFTAFLYEATRFNPDAMMAGDDFVDAQSTADAMIFHKIIHYYQAQDNLEQWKYWTDVFARIGTRYGRFIAAMSETATPEAIANRKIEEIQAKRNEKLNEKQSDGRTGKEIVEDVKENVKTTKDEALAVTAGGKATGKAKTKAAKNINSNKPKPIRITALSSKEKQEKAASAKSRLDKYKGYLKAKGLLQSPYTATKEMMDELSAMMDDVIGMGAKNKEEAMATFMNLLEGIGIKEADAQEIFDEIWDDATHGEAVKKEFSDYLANRVANVAVTQTKAKKAISDPVELLARALISKVSEIIPDATKARVKSDSKKTSPYAKLAELIKNGEISEQAWRDAMKEVEERIKARTDMSAEEKSSMIAMMEDTVSNFLTEPLPKALVRQAVKQGMKDADIVLDEVIQKSLTEQDNTGRTLAQKIIDATGLDVATAIELQDAVIADWNEMLGAKKRQRIAEILGVQEDGSPKAVQERKNTKKPSTVDKIMEAISLGVFDGDTFTDAFAEKFGFTKFTGKEIAKLVDFAQQIRSLGAVGEIQQRNRIISQMANYIASMDKFMAYRFFDFLSNFDYANIFTSVGTIKNIVVGSALANWTQRIPEFAGNVGWTVEKAARGTDKKAVFEGGKARQEFNKAFKGTGLKGGSVGAFFEVLKTGFNQIDNIESVYEDKAGQGNEFRYIADNRKALFKEAMQEKNLAKKIASVMAIGKSLANYGSNFASAFDTLFTFRGVEREAWAQAWREEAKKVNPDAYNYEQILNAVKKRVGYDAIQLAEAERKTDEAITALQSMGIKLPFGYKKQELRNQLAALRERELMEFATQAAQSANLLGKPTGLTGKAYEAVSRSRRFQYSNTNDLVGGWIGNLAKFTLKHSILMFLRISAKSMNVSLASIPVLGIVPNVVEFKPTTKTTTTMVGGREIKKTEEVWQTALRSRESFNKILGINAVATTVLLGAFAMMFRYNDDDEEYELDPDRMLDITLNQENVTGQKGGKYSDLGYTPLSIRFKKDGEWMPWMTYKYATPLVSSLSILGGIRDRNTYRLKDEQEQPTGVVGDGEEGASNLKQKGLGDQTFGDAMSDILSAQTELSFNQNMRLVQSIAEAFKKGQEGKSADYAVADITAQSTKAFRLSLPLTGNYANTAAGLIYDLTDVSNKKISVWQGVMQKNTAYEDLDIMGWIAEAVSDEPNVSGKQPFLDKYGYEVPRENALELLASSVPIVEYKQPAIRELITKPPYELKIKYPGMYVPPKYSATASTKIGKAIKEQDLPFAAKQSVENLVAQEWGKTMETAKAEDPEFNNMSIEEAEKFLQWTREVATGNITGQGTVTVKTSDGYTDNVTIEAYGLYKANPKLYFKIFPDVKQLNIVE